MSDKDCTSCKVIAVGCMLGTGAYLIKVAQSMDFKSKLPLCILGTAVMGLGVGEIFDKSPFRH